VARWNFKFGKWPSPLGLLTKLHMHGRYLIGRRQRIDGPLKPCDCGDYRQEQGDPTQQYAASTMFKCREKFWCCLPFGRRRCVDIAGIEF